MGCFLGCFGGPKDRRRSKPIHRIPSRERVPEHYKLQQQSSLPKQQQQQRSSPLQLQLLHGEGVLPGSHPESREPSEERVLTPPKQFPEEKSPTPVLELRDEGEKPKTSNPRKRVTFDLNVKTYEQVPLDDDEIYCSGDDIEEHKHSNEDTSQKEGSSTPLSSEAFPSSHRYQNCTISDGENSEEDREDNYSDDYEEEDDDCVLDDDNDDVTRWANEEEESFESYFSLPMEGEKQSCKPASGTRPIAASHVTRDRSRYVHSVLNPVENLSQWKEAKAKAQPLNLKLLKKENISVGQGLELAFNSHPSSEFPKLRKTLDPSPILRKDEDSVDTSLANWLSSSLETTPVEGSKGDSCCRTESKVNLCNQTIVGAVSN